MESHTTSGMGTFIPIWLGQFISSVGSSITGFAIGIWIYQHTESVTNLSLVTLSTTLPSLLFSPVVGVLVDRFSKRSIMFISDLGSTLCTGALGLLFVTGHLQLWHIYLVRSINSICRACQLPAYTTAITLLIPKKQLARINGLIQLGSSIAQMTSPLLGGILITTIEILGIILIDLATSVLALLTLLFTHFPDESQTTTSTSNVEKTSLFAEITFAWNHIKTKPGLVGLIIFMGIINFLFAFVGVLTVPLVMSFASATVLGLLMSIGASGTLVSSLAITIWGESLISMNYFFLSMLLGGLCILLVGLQAKVWLIAIAAFLFFFGTPVISSTIQVILQKKVPIDIQGRIFAFSGMIGGAMISVAYVLAGPLADYVFEPLMAPGGLLSETVGKIIGVGSGRGIGLMFMVTGGLTILLTALAYLYPPMRLVESDLPDIQTPDSNLIEPVSLIDEGSYAEGS
ncbi:MAG: MFS transporter [Scytonema sp. PMC 1069.18]|nr:MFS transporter [Scytonema sp. PMC 1069.18]MEC4885345.1 MFS transporter [Scytonema sp. PMC 1070.18]